MYNGVRALVIHGLGTIPRGIHMRFATSIFSFLASFALLLFALEAGNANPATNRPEPLFSVFDAAGVGLAMWIVSGLLVFRFPKASAVTYVLAGTVMLAFGFLDFGVWNGIFLFGVISFAFAAMAWASWLVQVLWTHAPQHRDVPAFEPKQSLARV